MNPQTYHKQEMEQRIGRFDSECETAINHIRHLKHKAESFLGQLSCDPKELKSRFLECTRQLDEFMYHITEFNLTASNLGNISHAYKTTTATPKLNRRSKTHSHSNTWRSGETKDSRTEQTKQVKEENSRELRASDPVKNIKKEMCENNEEVTVTDCQPLGLPPQHNLDPASVSEATIINVNGAQLWLVVDDDLLANLLQEMNEYYKNQEINEEYSPESVCAYYDEAETKGFYRAIYINSDNDPEVFLVDTGEFQPAPPGRLRPLPPRFRSAPPQAHLCCLADVDQTEDQHLEDRQTDLLMQFLGQRFKINFKMDHAEDDPSKPVYILLDDGRTVNELVQGLASSKPELKEESLIHTTNTDENENIPSDLDQKVNIDPKKGGSIDIEAELDYSKCPEYENVVEAVTGYCNRDEVDICKHYAGGEGCFKGQRCKKRHVMMHPDGWTLDRVSVVAKCRPAELPAPGTWHKVKVTHVDNTCQLYVQFEEKEEMMSLADLVEEMTSVAADSKPLQLEPAPGELVSAQFIDDRYYRARVISTDDSETEVMYIDYGNTARVGHGGLRALAPRWLPLPARAARCRLAGLPHVPHVPGVPHVPHVPGVPHVPRAPHVPHVPGTSVADVAEVLNQLALNKTMEAHIIARDFDELTVQLQDDGFDLAEQLAAFTGLTLEPYRVEEDSRRRCHHVPA